MVIETKTDPITEIYRALDRDEADGRKTELTKGDRARIWAGKKMGAFVALPTKTSSEKQKVHTFVDTAASEILTDPAKLSVIDEVWGADGELYGRVMAEIQNRMTRKELLPHRAITELVKLYASEEKAAPIAQELLKSYLNREGTPQTTADTLYDFLLASLDLVGGPSFEKAVLISTFGDPAVLSRSSEAYVKFMVARATVDNDHLLKKAWIVDSVGFGLIFLTSIDPYKVLNDNRRPLSTQQTQIIIAYENQAVERLATKLNVSIPKAKDEFHHRRGLLKEADLTIPVAFNTDYLDPLATKWPFNVLRDFNGDPLHDAFEGRVGSYITSKVQQRQFSAKLNKKDIASPDFFGISLPNVGLMVDVCASRKLTAQAKLAVFKRALKDLQGTDSVISILASSSGKNPLAIKEPWALGDNQLIHMYRARCVLDEKVHPLVIMDLIGFPTPILPDGKNVVDAIEEAKENIIDRYTSFLPENRGVAVPLRAAELRRGGYRSVTLTRCGNEVIARINILGIDYPVRLDGSYNLDFEGKIGPKPENIKPLHYVVLNAWQSIVCKDEKSDNGNGNGNGNGRKIFLGRIGYLRNIYGQNYSADAADRYFVEQNGKTGLQLVDEQERMRKLHNNSYNYTYVKEDPRERQGTGPIKAPGVDIPGYQ